jgi:hypothetical protein
VQQVLVEVNADGLAGRGADALPEDANEVLSAEAQGYLGFRARRLDDDDVCLGSGGIET